MYIVFSWSECMYHATYGIFIFFVASLFKTYQNVICYQLQIILLVFLPKIWKSFFPTENNI